MLTLLDAHCGLFGTDFMPHGHCYFWRPEIVWSHALSDALIAISYFVIPYGLIKLIRQRPDLRYKNLFLLFGLFIVACGSTHVLSIINIWTPLYRLDAIVKIITALASVPTAIILIRILPEAVKIPSLAAWQNMNKDLQKQIVELKEKDKTIEKVREFEFLTNSIPQIVWTADKTGQTNYYNDNWYEYTGIDRSAPSGWDWAAILHPEDRERSLARWMESVRTGMPYESEYRFLRASDGQYRWFLARAVAMRDENGEIEKWFGISTDVHDFKKAQEKVTEVSDKFHAIVNNAPVIIWSVDKNWKYTVSEGKGLESVLLKPGEIVGLDCREFLKDRDNGWLHNIGKALNGEEANAINEFGNVVFETTFSPLRNFNSDIIGMVGVSLDVTRRRKAESDSQFKSRFLASMSHEIRTPLNAVIGFANILEKTVLNNDQRNYVRLINQSGELLLKLIGDVLDLSKIEEGKLVLEHESFHLKENLNSCLHPYKYKAQENGIEFNLVFDDSTPEYVLGDKHKINQVIVNLIGNALKFTKKGKVQVRVDQVGLADKMVKLKFSVADSGIGIQKDQQEAIFESFTQADTSVQKEFGGSGLGLSIAQQLVQLMGGQLRVDSPHSYFSSPVGSCFWFVLMLPVDDKKQEQPVVEEKSKHFGDAIHVLVVEDNEVNQILARLVLKEIGCKTTFANNGKECLELLKKEPFDCILMDIQMPVMDGIEATQVIRNEFKSTIPIIGLSANVYKEDIAKSLAAGMNDHIGKPYTEEQIYRVIKNHVALPLQMPAKESITNVDFLNSLTSDKSEVLAILQKSAEQATKYGTQIREAVDQKNWETLSFVCHTFKSSARMIGATKLQLELGHLEDAANKKNEDSILEHFGMVKEMLEQVKVELAQKIQAIG